MTPIEYVAGGTMFAICDFLWSEQCRRAIRTSASNVSHPGVIFYAILSCAAVGASAALLFERLVRMARGT